MVQVQLLINMVNFNDKSPSFWTYAQILLIYIGILIAMVSLLLGVCCEPKPLTGIGKNWIQTIFEKIGILYRVTVVDQTLIRQE